MGILLVWRHTKSQIDNIYAQRDDDLITPPKKNCLFLKCCLGLINSSLGLNSCQLKTWPHKHQDAPEARSNRYKNEPQTNQLVRENPEKPTKLWEKNLSFILGLPKKLVTVLHDSSKETGKRSCWVIMIMSNQLLNDNCIVCECRVAPLLRLPRKRTTYPLMPFESSWPPNFSFPPTPLAVTWDVTSIFSGLYTKKFNFDKSTTVYSLFWQSALGRQPLWWCSRLSWKEEAKKIIALDLTAWYLWVTNATGECITVPDSTSLAFPKQSVMIMMADLGGIVCCLLTHEILSTRQDMLARLKKVRHTEHIARRYLPRSSLPRAHHTFSRHLEANSKFEDFCSAKETYFCSAQTLFLNLLGFETYKSRERRIRKKNCFPGHFHSKTLFEIWLNA